MPLRSQMLAVLCALACALVTAAPASAGSNSWTRIGLAGTTIRGVEARSASTVYAATPAGVMKTTDGGANWTARNTGLDSVNVSQVLGDPVDADTLYAVAGTTLHKTTDGGANWAATGPAGQTARFVAINPSDNDRLVAATNGGVFVSTDQGSNWSATTALPASTVAFRVTIAPSNPQVIYLGTSVLGGSEVFRTTDGGATWASANGSLGREAIYGIVVDPTDADHAWAATGFGPHETDNGGALWIDLGSTARSVAIASNGDLLFGFDFSASAVRGGVWSSFAFSGLGDASNRIDAADFVPGDVMTVYAGGGDGVFAYTEVPPVLPSNVTPPSITGTAQEGENVVCDTGTWNDATSLAREWFLDGAPAPGADSHTVVAGDVGKSLTCRVTAFSGAGSVSLTTAPVVPVAAPPPPPPPPPPSGGDSGGSSDPPPASPPPATSAPPVIPTAVAPIPPAVAAPKLVTRPRIAGRAKVRATLTCKAGRWSGEGVQLKYAWTRNGKAIRGASAARYRVAKGDRRRRLACVVTATNVAGSAKVASAAVGPVR